jgi:hypothetical protein
MGSTTLSTASRIDFVRGLELAEPRPMRSAEGIPRAAVPAPTPGQPAATVCAGSIISFTGNMSPQSQADALNSTLLAYLGASAQFDKDAHPIDWYKNYIDTLSAIGWDTQALRFSDYDTRGATLTINQVVLDALSAIATNDEIAVVTAMLDGLRTLPSSGRTMQIWESQSHTDHAANFQLSAASEISGKLAMRLGAFHFSTMQKIDTIFWTQYSNSTMTLQKAAGTITLDTGPYSQVRSQIASRLDEYAKSYFASIPLPPLPTKH